MRTPTVSVIIANFNRAHLLEQAIESVVEQDFQDLELIVFDDGSTDNSLEIIEQFKRRMPDKIRDFTHEGGANRGIVTTYLEAINRVRGKYVAFLEHDDRWSSNYLSLKVKVLDEFPDVGVVFSPYRIVSDGWFGKDMLLRQWLLSLTIKAGKPFDNFHNLLRSNNIATFSCFVTRKSLLDNLPVPSAGILAFDWWVLVQLSKKSLFYYDKKSHTFWRWSRDSAIGRQRYLDHKSQGCDYMELMYLQVDNSSDELTPQKRTDFDASREQFGYFLDYYRQPSVGGFFRFFVRSPVWALGATVSLVINYIKFR